MLAQLGTTFVQLFHLIGFFVLLWGVLMLLATMFNIKGPEGYFKGGLFILIGAWISRMIG